MCQVMGAGYRTIQNSALVFGRLSPELFHNSPPSLCLQFPLADGTRFFGRYPFCPRGATTTLLDPLSQAFQRVLEVPVLGTETAPDDDDTCGEMMKSHGGIRDVLVLPSGASGPKGRDAAFPL